jgi:hypothetical protein
VWKEVHFKGDLRAKLQVMRHSPYRALLYIYNVFQAKSLLTIGVACHLLRNGHHQRCRDILVDRLCIFLAHSWMDGCSSPTGDIHTSRSISCRAEDCYLEYISYEAFCIIGMKLQVLRRSTMNLSKDMKSLLDVQHVTYRTDTNSSCVRVYLDNDPRPCGFRCKIVHYQATRT